MVRAHEWNKIYFKSFVFLLFEGEHLLVIIPLLKKNNNKNS